MDSHGRWPNFLSKKSRREAEEEFEEEIISMVEEGQEQGVLQKNEAEMIQNVLDLSDKQAHDIMTRRSGILAISCDATLDEAIDYMIEENKSRFPVYREDLDDIIGMLHLRPTLVASRRSENRDMPISQIPDLLYEAYFIPESKGLHALFREMQSKKIHIAIVVDEYGQTAGLLTMEDILEEIVGSIMDESDEEEESIVAGRDGTFQIEGVTRLDAVQEALGIDFGDEEYETLNGFLVSKLDRIPSDGEKPEVTYQNYLFQAVRVENNMIQKVRVVPLGHRTAPRDR